MQCQHLGLQNQKRRLNSFIPCHAGQVDKAKPISSPALACERRKRSLSPAVCRVTKATFISLYTVDYPTMKTLDLKALIGDTIYWIYEGKDGICTYKSTRVVDINLKYGKIRYGTETFFMGNDIEERFFLEEDKFFTSEIEVKKEIARRYLEKAQQWEKRYMDMLV